MFSQNVLGPPPAILTNVHAVSSGSNSGRKLLKLPLHLLCKINKVCLLLEQLCCLTLVTQWKNLQCLLNEPYLFLTFLVSYLRSAAEYNIVIFFFPKNFFTKCTSVSVVEMFYNSHFIHTLLLVQMSRYHYILLTIIESTILYYCNIQMLHDLNENVVQIFLLL